MSAFSNFLTQWKEKTEKAIIEANAAKSLSPRSMRSQSEVAENISTAKRIQEKNNDGTKNGFNNFNILGVRTAEKTRESKEKLPNHKPTGNHLSLFGIGL